MKKTVILIPVFVLLLSVSFAQDTRSFFSVTGGYSLPIGELAKEKIDDPFTGLAGSGYFGQANYDFRIFRGLGLRFTGSMNLNTTNSKPIVDKAEVYASLLNDSFNWESDVSKWKLNAVMAGPALYLNLGRVQLEVHGQAGKIWANSPKVNLLGTSKSGNEPITVKMSDASTTAWGLAGGASLRFPIAKNLFFQLNGDVIGAEAELKNVSIHAKRGNFDYVDTIREKRFIGVVNVGAGFGVAF